MKHLFAQDSKRCYKQQLENTVLEMRFGFVTEACTNIIECSFVQISMADLCLVPQVYNANR